MDVKGLAGTWEVIWKHSDKSLERRLGKRVTIIISRKGVFQVVRPFTGQRVVLVKSTNAVFPASAGWYQRRMGKGMFFIRCKEKGKLEIHYFDNSPGVPCNRRFKNLSRYCVGGIGTIRTIPSTFTGTKKNIIVKIDYAWVHTNMTVCLYETPENWNSPLPPSASVQKS